MSLQSSTNAALPKISYVKSIDVYLGTCFVMVFASLLGKYKTLLNTQKTHVNILLCHFCSVCCSNRPSEKEISLSPISRKKKCLLSHHFSCVRHLRKHSFSFTNISLSILHQTPPTIQSRSRVQFYRNEIEIIRREELLQTRKFSAPTNTP